MNDVYIYDHDCLFIREPQNLRVQHLNGFKCSKGLLECYDVQKVEDPNFLNVSTWKFKIKGHEGVVYHTHYGWSLVKSTPANRKLLREIADHWVKIAELHKSKEELLKQVATVEGTKL